MSSNQFLGAELFVCGPMFTAEGGHGTEYAKMLPANQRQTFEAQTVRTPRSAAEAKQQVGDLKQKGVDCAKAILESGAEGMLFNRMDTKVYGAVVAAAKTGNLPVATHTGDLILLDRSLVQQVAPHSLVDSTRSALTSSADAASFKKPRYGPGAGDRSAEFESRLAGRRDTDHGHWRIGSIETGKDATLILVEGNPMDDISTLERITYVMFKGEHVDRASLFQQDGE